MENVFGVLAGLVNFESLNISGEMKTQLITGLIVGIILVVLPILPKKIVIYWKNTKTAQDLKPYFSYDNVKRARKFYIQTQFQNNSPAREEDPGFCLRHVSRSELIPFFIKEVFNEKKEGKGKFYLVLADSGMGKTTFMLNLYMKYTSFWNLRRDYKIKLLPFGCNEVLEKIKKIKDAERTILLLDAFDEDKKLVSPEQPDGMTNDERFRKRLDEIVEASKGFYEVIITSRTQYFPGQDDQDYELKIPKFYGDNGFHTLGKMYLSPFSNKEIKKYLNKKYGILRFWNKQKKRIAINVVNHSPRLMVRPMLLSYIELFVNSNREFKNTYEIYETLIEKWLERESEKRKYLHEREEFRRNLKECSRLIAVEIYKQSGQTSCLSLSESKSEEIARSNNINLKTQEITGQSLLTRDVEGNWKFAHKSIYEFIIAREIINNIWCLGRIHLDEMDMTVRFLGEHEWGFNFIKEGTFLMGSPENEAERGNKEKQHLVKLSSFFISRNLVTIEQFEIFVSEDRPVGLDGRWRCDVNGNVQVDKKHPIIYVSWNDAKAYCKWLSQKMGVEVRLPTEAEWEYACRAGTTTPFNTGENLTIEQANYIGKTMPVGSYPPNYWGLYDMHGNVWEWCLDWYSESYYDECEQQGTVENPIGPVNGSKSVLRGGSWSSGERCCGSAHRNCSRPHNRRSHVGFRPVLLP